MNFCKIIALIFLVLPKQAAYAQLKNSFVEGTIKLKNGQTITGLIKDDEIAEMNYRISFKGAEEENFVVYDTSQLRSFHLNNGEVYNLLQFRKQGMTKDVPVLAKLIVKGQASLFKIIYNNEDLYMVTNNEKTYVLQNDRIEPGQGSVEMTHYYFQNELFRAVKGSGITQDRLEKVSFTRQSIASVIIAYNKAEKAEYKVIVTKRKPVHFVIVNVGGMSKKANDNEVFFQGMYRTYFPSLSKGSNVNIGFNYFIRNSLSPETDYIYDTRTKYKQTLLSLPLQLQQNFFNKKIRPFVFAGFNLSYYNLTINNRAPTIPKGLQRNYGINILYGGGVEVDVYKGIMLKGDYRYENFSHLILLGIGYHFLVR